jgi:hypothetical protein
MTLLHLTVMLQGIAIIFLGLSVMQLNHAIKNLLTITSLHQQMITSSHLSHPAK